jgi:DNA repair protein RadC
MPNTMSDTAPDHSGHRARLRQRLIDGGPDALLDHELVEYLLMLTIPRRDTKQLAKELLKTFGGLGPLLMADREAMERAALSDSVMGAIKIAHATAIRLLKSEIIDRPVLGSWQAVLDYLHADMAHLATERVRVLYLNARNMLISDDLMAEGSVDQAAPHVREVIRRAMDLGAVSMILVHNHPSGDPQPSRADIDLTRTIIEAGRHLSITVHDHVIIGNSGHKSMRSMGLL